ncbi:HlyD family efflux transporter periplasmic adaptor subunit [Leptodesmis sp.]|uniref:HlyD family efflux transporter periplasmic adaptor subunit n=1 Tax=Leptodesmis sp. TaxID=3100501 RepID=UPI0040534F39
MQANTNYEKELLQTESLIDKARLGAQTRSAIAMAEIRAQEAAIAQAEAKIQSQATAITQAENRAATGQMVLAQLQADLALQRERLARFEYLANEGALAREQVFQAQQQLNDRQRSLTQQLGEIQQSQAESQRMRSELQQVVAEARRLRAELNRKYAEANNAQLQSQQAIQQLMVQKTQLQAKMQQNQKQLVQARAELNQLTLRAPADGYVSALNIRRTGEVAQAGPPIAEIAPQGVPLILSAALPTREAGLVKVGDRTQIKFDAYPYQDYGIISGKVIAISPDIKSDEKLGAVYRVEIALDRSSVTKDQQTIPLKAGQTATAEIVVRHRRIADVLLDPIRKLQETNLNL